MDEYCEEAINLANADDETEYRVNGRVSGLLTGTAIGAFGGPATAFGLAAAGGGAGDLVGWGIAKVKGAIREYNLTEEFQDMSREECKAQFVDAHNQASEGWGMPFKSTQQKALTNDLRREGMIPRR